jgi:hypothetical protein
MNRHIEYSLREAKSALDCLLDDEVTLSAIAAAGQSSRHSNGVGGCFLAATEARCATLCTLPKNSRAAIAEIGPH